MRDARAVDGCQPVLALDRRECSEHPVERGRVVEALGDREDRRGPEADEGELRRSEEAPVRAGERTGIGKCTGLDREADRDQLGARTHGRPERVAVRSWLSPPLSAWRLTAENPAATRSSRSSSVEGR